MKKLISTFIMTLILLSMLTFAFNIQPVKASGTIYIRADGSIDPSDAPLSSADNVTYVFTNNINNSIVIERNNIVIDGTGYTVRGNKVGTGIDFTGRRNITIKNTNIINFTYGLYLESASNCIFSRNNITSNEWGIGLYSSNNNTISENMITSNEHGILFGSGSSNNVILDNKMTNNSTGVEVYSSSYNTFLRNNMKRSGIFLGYSSSHCNVSRNNMDTATIDLEQSSHHMVFENNITNNTYGMIITSSSYNLFSGNHITNNTYGVWVQQSSCFNVFSGNYITNNKFDGLTLVAPQSSPNINNTVIGNYILNNGQSGIRLSGASYNNISENKITSSGGEYLESGVILKYSSNNTIDRNDITNEDVGIWLSSSSLNAITRNKITNARDCGIYLAESTNNTISENKIANNNNGIWIYASSNNFIHHNNFVNNTKQVYLDIPVTNTWDDGFEGNYWSHYNGVDSDHNGIGDTEYVIDESNQDNNPLMGMFFSFNASLNHNVNVISNSTIEDFEFFESNSTIKMHVSNITANQTYGFCRVCIPHALMDDPNVVRVVIDYGQTEMLFANLIIYDNSTHRWIYFAYEHSSHDVIIQSDTTVPTISILSPENKTYSVNDVPLIFTVNELTGWIGYSLNGQANITITGDTTLTSLLDGSHYVIIYANDTAGNMGTSGKIYFTIDTTPPNIMDVSQTPPKDNVQPGDKVKVNATIIDSISRVKQVLLNYTYTNSSGTWFNIVNMSNLEDNVWNATIPALPFGTNVTYVIMAEDNAGNTVTTRELGYEYQYHVISEFPSLIILSLFMITILLAVIVYRRKYSM